MSKNSIKMMAGRPSQTKPNLTLEDITQKSKVRINFDIDKTNHKKLKIYAAQQGKTIAEILRNLIERI